ncbi:MAG: DHH family phosphoesterase [Tepidisphaeraceae bacterium]
MPDQYQQLIDALSSMKRVLITTHVRPDGDALGSCAAVSLGLRKVGIESQILVLTHVPTKYAFIFDDYQIPYLDVELGYATNFTLDDYDGLLVVDTGTWSQLPGLRDRVERWGKRKLVIDHHLTQENWADVKLVVSEAAAAGEIVAELLARWNIALDSPIATAIFLAIASDTGWFQFSNTRPSTMRLAATLMEAGVDTDRMYQHLYQSERPQRVALQTRAMQSMQLLADNTVAVMTIEKNDFVQTGAGVPATENLINIPLQIGSIEVSMLFVEPPEGGPIRVSFRSKGRIDVSKFAERFGGGGHARASGMKLQEPLSQAKLRVVDAMLQVVKSG